MTKPFEVNLLSKVRPADHSSQKWTSLQNQIIECERCPRLREHCLHIAETKRKSFQDWEYWGKPVPNLGSPKSPVLLVGLAPAAHGANRTGRMFTGDRSGDWLFRALHKAGFCNQPHATDANDGLQLINCTITATCHCAPPQNKPTSQEIKNCLQWLEETIDILNPTVFIALGQIAWKTLIPLFRQRDWYGGKVPKFSHGELVPLNQEKWLLGSYHPSQQNTFTGRLTEPMFDAVFAKAKELAKT